MEKNMEEIKSYGIEVIIDLHDCDITTFTRKSIEQYFIELCKKIKMKRCALYWWDDENTPEEEKQTDPKLVGISAIQFILTSNITIHTLPLMKRAYLNIFSCKQFPTDTTIEFSTNWFKGRIVSSHEFERI